MTVHRREGQSVRRTPERIEVPSGLTRVAMPVVFGGHLPKHFGHFLLESLARTWVYPTRHPGPLPFIHFRERFHLHEEALLDAVLAPHGTTPLAVTTPSRFDSVLVPEQGMDLGSDYAPEMRATFDTIRDHLVESGLDPAEDPLYLSRTRLDRGRRATLGEHELERRLHRHGIRIVHPQELALSDQIRLISSARTILGLHGTALHLGVFRDLPESRTIALNPRKPHPPQERVDRLRGSTHVHLHVQFPLHPRIPGAWDGRAVEVGPYRNFIVPPHAERKILATL